MEEVPTAIEKGVSLREPRGMRRWWMGLVMLCGVFAGTAFAQESAAGSAAGADEHASLSLGMVFTAFMVMLGPVKVIGPFARMTAALNESEARKVAGMALGCSCIGGLVVAVFGKSVLMSWNISLAALHLAGGLVLLLVALKAVLAQYEPAAPQSASAANAGNFVLTPLTFPTILTPHGIAIFILLLAVTRDTVKDVYIIAIFFAVMVLNWLAMLFARAIIRNGGVVLLLMDTVFAVLQVALGIQITIEALRTLQVLPPA